MQVTYCRRWNFLHDQPIDPLTEAQARKRDAAGKLYTVVLGDPAGPEKIIEVVRASGHVGVAFFDPLQRQSLYYTFTRVDDDTMFLHGMTNWKYPNDAAKTINESCWIEHFEYHQDGIVEHEVRDEQADEIRITKYRDVKLDINWEPVPAFGDWDAIARYDRQPPASPRHRTRSDRRQHARRWPPSWSARQAMAAGMSTMTTRLSGAGHAA